MKQILIIFLLIHFVTLQVFAQDDGQWTHYPDFKYVWSLAIGDNNELWAGEDGGIYHFDGMSWEYYSLEEIQAEDNVYSMVFKEGKLHVVAGTYATFYNNTWSLRLEGSENLSEPIAIDVAPNDDVWICSSGNEIFRFNGTSWNHYTEDDGLPTNDFYSVDVDESGAVWFGTAHNGLLHFDGENWTQYTEENGLGGLHDIIVKVGPDGIVWCSGRKINPEADASAWIAHNKNNNGWMIVEGYPLSHNTTLNVESTDEIWASYRQKLASYDGFEWKEYSLPDSKSVIASLAIDSNGIIWIGTFENGIFRFDPNPTAVEETAQPPKQVSIMCNYPNPFNSSTLISFQVPERAYCELSIYSLSGQCVKTLISSTIHQGGHYVYWNGKDAKNQTVASAIYLVRLQLGTNFDMHKITYAK